MNPIAAADSEPIIRNLRELEERVLNRVRQVAADVDRRVRNVLGDDPHLDQTPPASANDARD